MNYLLRYDLGPLTMAGRLRSLDRGSLRILDDDLPKVQGVTASRRQLRNPLAENAFRDAGQGYFVRRARILGFSPRFSAFRTQKSSKTVKKNEKRVAGLNELASIRASTAGAPFKSAPRKGPSRRAFIIGSDSG